MKNDLTISIPLISFSIDQEGWEPDHERGEKIFHANTYTRISPPMELPDLCYGVQTKDMDQSPLLPPASLAIFSKTDGVALGGIYAVSVQDSMPFIGKWVQKEPLGGSRRKVFMVPTPMHVPSSKVSPIADSLHQVLLFKDLANTGKLRLIPANKILWKHRLVYVEKNNT